MTKNKRNKILLHACPRCQGDLFPDNDDDGFFTCLQCGRTIAEARIGAQAVAALEATPEPALAKVA